MKKTSMLYSLVYTQKETYNRIFHACRMVIAIVFLLCLSGCGGPNKPDGLPTLYPCKITITQLGKPLEGALVQFHGVDHSVPWTVNGITNGAGVAIIKTQTLFTGAPEGQYVVTVMKKVQDKSQLSDSPPRGASKEEIEQWYDAKESERLAIHSFVSSQFASPIYSPLMMTVTSTSKSNIETLDVGQSVEEIVAISY